MIAYTMADLLHRDYLSYRITPEGVGCGVKADWPLAYLDLGVRLDGTDVRYSFGSVAEAIHAMSEWDGKGDPPGAWLRKVVNGVITVGPGSA